MKKVSIIVPVYNSEKFLPKLIESILNQTYNNIELILVDDESPDNCAQICDDYATKDKRVVVIHEKNAGCCAARNAGLNRASGEYIMLADGDDWMELDCIEYLINLMEKNGCEMAMTDSVFTTRNQMQNTEDNVRVWSKEEAICGILYAYIPIGPWNKIYTAKVLKENNISFSVPWFGEGLYFSTMAAQYSNKVAVGHRKIYNYRLNNPNSGTTVRQIQHGINALSNIKNIKDKLIVRTSATIQAANWHICYNCYFLMCYIIWANALNEYGNLYIITKKELRKMAPGAIFFSKVKLWKKIYILTACIAPKTLAKIVMHRKTRRFKADVMQ